MLRGDGEQERRMDAMDVSVGNADGVERQKVKSDAGACECQGPPIIDGQIDPRHGD